MFCCRVCKDRQRSSCSRRRHIFSSHGTSLLPSRWRKTLCRLKKNMKRFVIKKKIIILDVLADKNWKGDELSDSTIVRWCVIETSGSLVTNWQCRLGVGLFAVLHRKISEYFRVIVAVYEYRRPRATQASSSSSLWFFHQILSMYDWLDAIHVWESLFCAIRSFHYVKAGYTRGDVEIRHVILYLTVTIDRVSHRRKNCPSAEELSLPL